MGGTVLPPHTKLNGYRTAWTYGHKLGFEMWRLQWKGNIRVFGLDRNVIDALAAGKCIIDSNHKSVIDDFFLAGLFWRNYLLNDRFFPWSMPDQRILESCDMTEARCRRLRCIVVDRSNPKAGIRGLQMGREVLRRRYNLSVHSEEGRTDGASNQNKPLFVEGPRRLRQLSDGVFLMADTETTFIPLYIDMPHIEDMPTTWDRSVVQEPLRRIRGEAGPQYLPVCFYFGKPYRLPEGFNRKDKAAVEAARLDLQKKILLA